MATITVTKGYTGSGGAGWISNETVTPEKLNLAQTPTVSISSIVNADVSASADIAGSKLASSTITNRELAPTAISSQTQLADALAASDQFMVHDASATALRRVAWSAMQPAGSVLQTLQDSTSDLITVTSTLALNDTAPTNSSGTQILSKAITLSSDSSKVLVRATAWGGDVGILYAFLLIVRGSTVVQVGGSHSANATDAAVVSTEYLDSPATAGSVTYTVRAAVSTGSWRINGDIAGTPARVFGGKSYATLTLQEIKG
jgi:hypothetical protein